MRPWCPARRAAVVARPGCLNQPVVGQKAKRRLQDADRLEHDSKKKTIKTIKCHGKRLKAIKKLLKLI